MSNRAFPSMTALLALLAMAGYQNRDKIAEMIKGATQGGRPDEAGLPNQSGLPGQTRQPQPEEGGGGLGGLLGGLGGLFGGAASGNLLQNGLSELLDRFRQNGHDEADSWVGTGENREIDDRNLEHAIGPDVLQTLSEQTGLSREELLARLSRTLPKAVDAYTPNGRLEDA
ncbi:YidB family protein [Starkeya koreensis]|uniref:YidB family protein n=1 Tax=Ancylobacter koreensis TaxID=266121 RepID=A0ABT0DIS5_9HYPH|nr:YidB family protein [Ancylobacter koreensis]MCK0207186.1 YidB family protein [Ancylobacter koreensis]